MRSETFHFLLNKCADTIYSTSMINVIGDYCEQYAEAFQNNSAVDFNQGRFITALRDEYLDNTNCNDFCELPQESKDNFYRDLGIFLSVMKRYKIQKGGA